LVIPASAASCLPYPHLFACLQLRRETHAMSQHCCGLQHRHPHLDFVIIDVGNEMMVPANQEWANWLCYWSNMDAFYLKPSNLPKRSELN